MRTLSIEDIKENPWNVMKYPLPEFPSKLLLLLAQVAATCCRQIASEIIDDLHATYGHSEPLCPELEPALHDWHRTHRKIGEAIHLLYDRFGLENFDFNLSRPLRKSGVRAWLKGLMRRF